MKKSKILTRGKTLTLQILLISLFMLLTFSAEAFAYTVAGQGTDPKKGTVEPTYPMSPYVRPIDGSEMTLQQIADANGAWLWVDTTGNGLAERYFFLSSDTYLVNTITPDGFTVDPLGRWHVNGYIIHRLSSDQNLVDQAAARAALVHGNSYNGIYSGPITFQGGKTKYYTIDVTETSATELNVVLSDNEGLDTIKYTYVGVNIPHPGIVMFQSNKKDLTKYLLFYGPNTIVYYNYDGSPAGQLIKVG